MTARQLARRFLTAIGAHRVTRGTPVLAPRPVPTHKLAVREPNERVIESILGNQPVYGSEDSR